MSYIIYQHELIKRSEFKIDINDRSFRFGDGCFETIYFQNGKPFYPELHIERLNRSLAVLLINIDTSQIHSEIEQIIQANKIDTGMLRIIASRGNSSIGYLPTVTDKSYYLIECEEYQFKKPEIVLLWLSKWRKPASNVLPVQSKYSGNINSVLARIEAAENLCFEALQLTDSDLIAECSSSNIIWFKGNQIFSPDINCNRLDGITLNLFQQTCNSTIEFGKYSIEDLTDADEIIIMNTAWRLINVDFMPQFKRSFSKEISEKYINLFNEHITAYCK